MNILSSQQNHFVTEVKESSGAFQSPQESTGMSLREIPDELQPILITFGHTAICSTDTGALLLPLEPWAKVLSPPRHGQAESWTSPYVG